MVADIPSSSAKPPLIWALTTGRPGDDSQVMLAAKAASGTVRRIDLKFNRLRKMPNRIMGASLRSVVNTPDFSGPWPDLVIGAGCRSVPPAMWIKKQSGGRTRLLRLGRPRAPLHWFDLVLTTPQYGVPAQANVMQISLPLAEPPAVPTASIGPVLAIFGGNSRTCRITPEFARLFAHQAAQMANAKGADLKVSTSPRTPSESVDILSEALTNNADIHVWQPNEAGPYRDWLNAAQACLVTGDSASVIADAILTGRPVTVLMPPLARLLAAAESVGGEALKRWFFKGGNRSFLAPPPNIEALMSHMVSAGCASRVDKHTIVIEGASDLATREYADARARIIELASK